MYKISIDDIEKTGSYHVNFDDDIPEIKAHVKAGIDLISTGEFIEASGEVKGTIRLECDLCLSEFDYSLDFPIKEMFAKSALFPDPKQETELKSGQFITDLNGEDDIDIYDLLYQSVILCLPNKKVCGINCKGGGFVQDDELSVRDERMAVFKTIKTKDDKVEI